MNISPSYGTSYGSIYGSRAAGLSDAGNGQRLPGQSDTETGAGSRLQGLGQDEKDDKKLKGLGQDEKDDKKLKGLGQDEKDDKKLKGLAQDEKDDKKLKGLGQDDEDGKKPWDLEQDEKDAKKLKGLGQDDEDDKKPWDLEKDDKKKKGLGQECETCKERKYKDGSDEMVSFKTPTHISPQSAASAVRAHEQEHVSNAYAKAAMKNGKVISASVSIHTAICPECGRTYISGGTTHTQIRYYNEDNPYQQGLKSADRARYSGLNFNYRL